MLSVFQFGTKVIENSFKLCGNLLASPEFSTEIESRKESCIC